MNSNHLQKTCSRLLGALCLAMLALSLGTSCTTSKSASSPRPGRGLEEYLELVSHSRAAVDSAVRSLDSLVQKAAPPSKSDVAAFSEEVDRLGARSLQIRARSQAMQARGDAYFQDWQKNMESIEDPKVRALAEQHRVDLQQSFAAIKATSQRTRELFQTFLSGLRQVRSAIESDPARLSSDSTKGVATRTVQGGLEVEQGLDAIAGELKKMTGMIKPQ